MTTTAHSTRATVRIDGVRKRFGQVEAVRGVSLEIREGSLCGFLGPNGAGKSTTIRMIMSIISPDAGTVEVMGSSALAMKDRIGYLPEERGLYRKMRVVEFVGYMAKLKGVHAAGIARRIDDWLERLALPGVAKRRCEELSKGQQQKIQLLRFTQTQRFIGSRSSTRPTSSSSTSPSRGSIRSTGASSSSSSAPSRRAARP